MGLNFTLKDIREELQYIHRRVYCAAVIMLLLVMLLATWLFYLQVIRYGHFVSLSENNSVKVLPIAPIRGLIFSRDNVLVAENRFSFNLELVAEEIEDINELIARFSGVIDITDKDIKRFNELKTKKRFSNSIPLKFNLSQDEVARFSVDLYKFPDVEVTAGPYRFYPKKSYLVHVLGYVGRIDEKELQRIDKSNYLATNYIGKSGIEKAYEDILHGSIGHQQVEVNAQGSIIRVIDEGVSPKAGGNIYLTIDSSLQDLATELMKGRRGAIVAMEPNNGDVLALVSSPAYDPNPFVNGIDQASYQSIVNNKDKPLINRVLTGQYPPGSAIKPFLGLAALSSAVRSIDDDEKTWCKGWYSLHGDSHRYRDWKKEGHGAVNLNQAIAQSCDVYFYSLAHDLGINSINKSLKDFGFGLKTEIDIGGESAGLLPSAKWKSRTLGQPWYPGETLITGIGQGYTLVTPLQLVTAISRLANHGKYIIPRLVYKISYPDLDKTEFLPVREFQNQSLGYTQQYWDHIIQAMEDVVHSTTGTARASGVGASYSFAGKTGTAQVFGIAQDDEYEEDDVPEHLRDHALFVAFAPVKYSQIALAVIVENGGSGSSTAAPIARQLFDHYLLNESGNMK